MPHTLKKSDLRQFTGSEKFYRHGINRKVIFTEGAKHVADEGGAYWLLDEIALAQHFNKPLPRFQVWTLKVREDRKATLTCEDGNSNQMYQKHIPYTDFPLGEITLWFAGDTSICRVSIKP